MRRSSVLFIVVGLLMFGSVGYFAGSAHLLSPEHSAAADDCQSFPQTGFQACGDFLNYWNTHGGLAQQGYPISPTFQEKSETDGITRTVQYFERAVFEAHPENQPPNNVLLSLLGSQKYKAKYPNGAPVGSTASSTVAPPPPAAAPANGSELIGQSVRFAGSFGSGSFQGTVTDAKRGVSLPGVTPSGVFLVVTLKVTNVGTAPADVGAFSLMVVDSKGRQFSSPDDTNVQSAAEKQYNLKGTYTTIQPSLSLSIVLAFDIAPDATGLKMVAGTQ